MRDARGFLRRELDLPDLCVNSWSSSSCCQSLQTHGQCNTELVSTGHLFGYCARTCGRCGFEDHDFQQYRFEPKPQLRMNVNAKQVVGRVSSLLICGAVAAGTVFGCLVALFLFLNHTFDTSHAKLEKGIKLVALSALVFTGASLLAAGAGCTPNAAMRDAHTALSDLEVEQIDLWVMPENVHLSFTVSVTALVEDVGLRNPVELAAAKLVGRYTHGNKALRLGTLGWERTRLKTGSQTRFSTRMNSTLYRDDFWGAWMATDYYNNQLELEFGPSTVQFDLIPDNVILNWVLASSDTSISYSYACNYTVFARALFYNSMSCRVAPRAVPDGVYGRLRALSHACYSIGSIILCLSLMAHFHWFPPARAMVVATECHGEIAHVEARMCDVDLSRPLARCSFNFALTDVTIFDDSGQAVSIPGTSMEEMGETGHDHSTCYLELEEIERRLAKCAYDACPEPHEPYAASLFGPSDVLQPSQSHDADQTHLVHIDVDY